MNIDEEEEEAADEEFEFINFYKKHFIQPKKFQSNLLLSNNNQVAGHAGFYSIRGSRNLCLKQFNVECVRGRREHLFYQLVEFFKKQNIELKYQSETTTTIESTTNTKTKKVNLHYKNLELLTYPSPATKCNCVIDESLFRLLSSFVAKFHCVKHISKTNDQDNNQDDTDQFLNSVYSKSLQCPCYGRNPKEKTSCSRDYEKTNFLCLQDLTAHCLEPCIIDIKIGQITYDPMAIKEKVLEQSSKYRQLKQFGFRILGMKLGDEVKGKTFGKTLETSEQVFDALNCFFIPIKDRDYICCIIEAIINRMESLLEWFEYKNINQLRFYSSSLLIVYDCKLAEDNLHLVGPEREALKDKLADSIRVSMIDFAHVFHVHLDHQQHSMQTKDNNYIFGLKKLKSFLINLKDHHRGHSL